MSEKTCIVVRKRCCNRIFYVCSERHLDATEKKEIMKYAKQGCKTERMTLEDFNKEGFGAPCECNKKSMEAANSLFGEEKGENETRS